MSDRKFPFKENSLCDNCGAKGAYGIYGGVLCQKCLEPSASSDARSGTDGTTLASRPEPSELATAGQSSRHKVTKIAAESGQAIGKLQDRIGELTRERDKLKATFKENRSRCANKIFEHLETISRLRSEVERLTEELGKRDQDVQRLGGAILWALGEGDSDFPGTDSKRPLAWRNKLWELSGFRRPLCCVERIESLESQVRELTGERDRFHTWAMANGFCQLCPNCKSDGNCGHSAGW